MLAVAHYPACRWHRHLQVTGHAPRHAYRPPCTAPHHHVCSLCWPAAAWIRCRTSLPHPANSQWQCSKSEHTGSKRGSREWDRWTASSWELGAGSTCAPPPLSPLSRTPRRVVISYLLPAGGTAHAPSTLWAHCHPLVAGGSAAAAAAYSSGQQRAAAGTPAAA